jgi:protein-tyrosine phosphatase
MVRVCFVCTGNICRSPTAEGVMRRLVERAGLAAAIEIDSAATGPWHVGDEADERARAAGERRGFCIDSIARQVTPADFARFDYLIAMDRTHVRDLERLAPRGARGVVRLLRSFDPAAPAGAAVPDPYYGGADGFEEVLDICEAACGGLLEHIAREHRLR